MTILVTGANGQVGQEFRRLAMDPALAFLFTGRDELDITDRGAVLRYFETHRPTHCINCAAYTAVDRAESEPGAAAALNENGAANLAYACALSSTRLIHLSTDYVFDGRGNRPYVETDPTGPTGIYGATKLAGERRCREEDPQSIVIRTSWVFSSYGSNFVKTMLRLMTERDQVRVVNDQHGCPTYAADLADSILHIIRAGEWTPGIYHIANEGETTWFQLAMEIRDRCGLTCAVEPIGTAGFPTAARRPAYSVLDTEKIRSVYGLAPRHWKEALADCLGRLGHRM
ncbi:MAG: dTDP-4-dehydrorhamnose reductase [Flaviaesturariibacter sp.]|nr:dTDP-4-dehydrorhamnose reductase [Flaviaesturariibacter sp.]